MLIEVKDDVIEKAINDRNNKINNAADFLRDLSIAVKRNKHIIYVPCLLNNNIDNEIAEIIGQQYANLLKLGLAHRFEIGRIKDLVSISCWISYDKQITVPGNVVLINPDLMPSFECFQGTHLITENLADSIFFKNMVDYYCRENNITICSYYFYPLMGGGNTSANVLEAEISLKQHFSIAISDSDKHYPNADMGSTYQRMKDVMDRTNPTHCALLGMQNVAEIENLIPHKYLREHNQYTNEHEKVFEGDPDHYDIKKGFGVRALWNDNLYNYWKSIFPDIDYSQRDRFKAEYNNKSDYDKAAKSLSNDHLINLCWGGNVLSELLDEHNFSLVSKEELTDNQKKEWYSIGGFIFSWSCCLNNNRVL